MAIRIPPLWPREFPTRGVMVIGLDGASVVPPVQPCAGLLWSVAS